MTTARRSLIKEKKSCVVVLGGGWGGMATARHLREGALD
jgi:NADH dehydrogenase FAD-containing subunit